MKRLLVLSWLTLHASAAHAGLDLTWEACNVSGGDSTKVFSCEDPESVATLVGCFQPPDSTPRFVALGISINFRTESKDVEPYWHFESGGCNRSGLTFSDAVPPGCEATAHNPWGDQGADAIGAMALYQPMYDGRNTARMICLVARSAAEPTALAAGENYFGFQLRFFSENAREAGGKCDGCTQPMVFQWTAASLSRVAEKPGDPPPPDVVITGSGRRSNCARANGAKHGTCAAIPPPRHAWDSLRSVQR